jgi:hypothetical protein
MFREARLICVDSLIDVAMGSANHTLVPQRRASLWSQVFQAYCGCAKKYASGT